MIEITQVNDKKEKYQSYECTIKIDTSYEYSYGYGKDTKESVDDFKEGILKWKEELDKAFESINYNELYNFDGGKDRVLRYK